MEICNKTFVCFGCWGLSIATTDSVCVSMWVSGVCENTDMRGKKKLKLVLVIIVCFKNKVEAQPSCVWQPIWWRGARKHSEITTYKRKCERAVTKVWKRVGQQTSDLWGRFHFPLPTQPLSVPTARGACALPPYTNATGYLEWETISCCHNAANMLLQKTQAMLERKSPHRRSINSGVTTLRAI